MEKWWNSARHCLVQDLTPGNSFPQGLTSVNNDLFFGTIGFPSAGLYKVSNEGNDHVINGSEGNDTINGGNNLNNTINGKAGNDKLSGKNGDDILIGGIGDDTLTGGKGQDSFSFNSPKEGVDTIKDFIPKDDTIVVRAQGFKGSLVAGSVIPSEQFVLGSTATDNSDRFIYNKATGELFFDSDGGGVKQSVLLAQLSTRPLLTNADIFVEVRGWPGSLISA